MTFRDRQKLTSYFFLAATSAVLFIGLWQLLPIVGKPLLYGSFILLSTLNSWFNGLKPSIFISAFFSILAGYFLLLPLDYLSPSQIITAIEIASFCLIGVLISFVIDRYKKTRLVDIYNQKEKIYLQKIATLKDTVIKMRKEVKVRDEFLSIASHELKTPLTSMLLKLQTALYNVRNVSLANFSVENLLKMLQTAENQTQRLSKMINDLLNVSLITTQKLELEIDETDVASVVREVVEEFSERLEKEGCKLTLESDEVVTAWVDKLRIEQVITNLISNALKYGNSKPISIKISKANSIIKITVADHGIGIPKNQQERIFALFDRGEVNNGYKGLGVGLYISNQIITAHGGTITLKSKVNAGSTFEVMLPARPPKKLQKIKS